MYVTRHAEQTVLGLLREAKVVLVTGARQVGKTTMLKHCMPEGYGYVSLDAPDAERLARDPELFFQRYAPPVVIDEVQRRPELFDYVKHLVDQSDARGQIVLTGSQTFHLMKGVSESLAGRVAILELSGLSLREVLGSPNRQPFVPQVFDRYRGARTPHDLDLWHRIHRGSMPALADESLDWERYYRDYTRTYLERDVRGLVAVQDEDAFYRFLVACAARSGQLFNAAGVADDVGVSPKTAQHWLSVLQASGVAFLLRPFWSNVGKRLTKAPKLYFYDTGLVCYLTGWIDEEVARRGAASGSLFETFAVGEVMKSYLNAARDTRVVRFYRDGRRREIDLVLQRGRALHPVEVKQAAVVGTDAASSFRALEAFGDYELGEGALICQTAEPVPVSGDVTALPVWCI